VAFIGSGGPRNTAFIFKKYWIHLIYFSKQVRYPKRGFLISVNLRRQINVREG
jgi:hypothetical protein